MIMHAHLSKSTCLKCVTYCWLHRLFYFLVSSEMHACILNTYNLSSFELMTIIHTTTFDHVGQRITHPLTAFPQLQSIVIFAKVVVVHTFDDFDSASHFVIG